MMAKKKIEHHQRHPRGQPAAEKFADDDLGPGHRLGEQRKDGARLAFPESAVPMVTMAITSAETQMSSRQISFT